jgi:sugar phosphate isomerase/epimerase
MDRRQFVGSLGAAALAPGVIRDSFIRDHLDRIGLQLYTVRDRMQQSVEKTLYDVARVGYREVEFAGYFGRPPRAIKQLLDRNDLKSPAAHVPIAKLSAGWYQTLTEAAQMDQKWLVVAWIGEEDRNSIDAIKRTAELFNRAGEDAKTFKIRLAYHNHDFEFAEVEGRRIFDVLLEETDPEFVDFEMDLYWITKGGADPLAYFERWPGRFPLVHVKDSGPAPERKMTEVGKGTIDFARIFSQRKLAGTKHFFVEHDNPADSLASIGVSYRYLDSLEFAG